MTLPRLLLAACALLPVGIPVSAMAEIVVHDPWVRWVPPVSETTAAYMRIEAPEDERKILIGVDSPQFDRAEIHESVEEDGRSRMLHWSTLRIGAGETRVLEPGGYHIMLLQRRVDGLEEGDTVRIQLRFQSGEILEIDAPVRRDGRRGDGHDHHGHHDHH